MDPITIETETHASASPKSAAAVLARFGMPRHAAGLGSGRRECSAGGGRRRIAMRCWWWCALLMVSGCEPKRPAPAHQPELRAEHSIRGDGVSVTLHRYRRRESSGRLWLARVAPEAARIELIAAERPQPLSAVVGAIGGELVAVNGGFYDADRPMGWVVSGGETRAPLTRGGGSGVLVSVDGEPRIVHRDAAAALAGPVPPALALQSIDRLVDEGRVLVRPRRDAPRDARSAVAIDGQGALLFVVVFDERAIARESAREIVLDADCSTTGLTLLELAELLVRLGARTALNLDGGYSTSMRVRLGGEARDVVAHRATINALVARPR